MTRTNPQRATLPDDPQWWTLQFAIGFTVPSLAAQFGVSDMTIYRTLRRLGLTRSAPVPFEQWLASHTTPAGACLRWTRAHSTDGYPLTFVDGHRVLANRVVWQHHHGAIPNGHDIVHTEDCRYRDCVRSSHLRPVDTATRFAQQAEEGIFPHGEYHWNAKLTEQQVRYILSSPLPTIDLAHAFGVSRHTIKAIRAKRRWRHLTQPS
jgi:hypothetical protein